VQVHRLRAFIESEREGCLAVLQPHMPRDLAIVVDAIVAVEVLDRKSPQKRINRVIVERSMAVCQPFVAASAAFVVSVSRRIIHGRRCSTIALARFRNWNVSVAPIEAPPLRSCVNMASSAPFMLR
jgi:hypothetical protein